MATATLGTRTQTRAFPLTPGDLVALIGGILIIVAYLLLPLRIDKTETGFGFISDSTTFSDLTLVVGAVAIVSVLVNVTALHESSVRAWFAGLGVMGLVFLIDNSLSGRAPLAIGGVLAMLGSSLLIIQVVLPRPGYISAPRAADTVLGLIRILLATLWFSQLLWKLPWNNFGCPAGPLLPAAGSSGLCDWIGREIAQPRWGVYHDFLTNVIGPNLSTFALPIVLAEMFVCFSLTFGFLTRLGGLVGLLQGLNLFIGLTAVRGEWDWTYLQLVALNAVILVVGGRFVGLDAILYARLKASKSGPIKLLARLFA